MKVRFGLSLAGLAVGCFAIGLVVADSQPEPPRKGDRWEYCELQYRVTSGRGAPAGWVVPAGQAGKGKAAKAGGKGGVRGEDGKGGAGAGGQGGDGGRGGKGGMAGPGGGQLVARATARLVTGTDEIEADGWEDLATKLKAPPAKKKGASVTLHKMRVLNHLGSQGWELVSAGSELSSSNTLLFKRKATP